MSDTRTIQVGGASRITAERIRQARWARYNPIRNLTPEVLTGYLEQFRGGAFRSAALVWDAQLRRDLLLMADSSKRAKAVSKCDWEILTSEKSARAEQHADALRFFYNNLRVRTALDDRERGGFRLLIRQMMSSVGMKYAVHEMRLAPVAGKGVTGEFVFCPLWWFSAEMGPFSYLKSEWDLYGEPLQDNEWLVTVGDGLMEACSIAYVLKNLSLFDWVAYGEKFGLPGVLGKTNASKGSAEWEAMEDAVSKFMGDWAAVCNEGEGISLIETKGSGSTLPFEPLIDKLDRYIAAAWRGSDLATLSQAGEHSGASVQGEEVNILADDDAPRCTETLNQQVDTPVIRYLFGEEPLAYLSIIPPRKTDTEAVIKKASFLIANNVPVGETQLRESLAWPAPAEDEPLITAREAAQPNPQDASDPQSLANQKPEARNQKPVLSESQRKAIFTALDRDLKPLRDRLAEAERMITETTEQSALAGILTSLLTDIQILQNRYERETRLGQSRSAAALEIATVLSQVMALRATQS